MWSKGNTHPLLVVGMQTCITTLEISMVVSQKIGNQPTSGLNNTTLGHIPKGGSVILQRHFFNYIHSSIIYIARPKHPRCPLTKQWIKKTSHIYTLEYYFAEKKKNQWHLEIYMKRDGTRKHHPE